MIDDKDDFKRQHVKKYNRIISTDENGATNVHCRS